VKKEKFPCGCIASRERELWLHLCDEHQQEYDQLHRQAAKDLAERRARDEPA
jgi:hypothetical protein